ncbi:MAG: DUF2764 family protein [Ruminococcaceae bacterium]|nr:DUF2764 family protein [Oscillospiraceae bacterium]
MAEYYLISQLPSLDGVSENAPLPITEERFLELCGRFLGKKACDELTRVTLLPPREEQKSTSALVQAWNEGERHLRLVLAKARAEKLQKSFEEDIPSPSPALLQAVLSAVEAENPLEAEKHLLRYRLAFLEELRPTDAFAQDYLFYYLLKLKLLLRIRHFDTDSGAAAYKNIYDSIMRGERLEVVK